MILEQYSSVSWIKNTVSNMPGKEIRDIHSNTLEILSELENNNSYKNQNKMRQ